MACSPSLYNLGSLFSVCTLPCTRPKGFQHRPPAAQWGPGNRNQTKDFWVANSRPRMTAKIKEDKEREDQR
eukprot:763829-Hanusia_phi.AAC.3